MKYLVVAIEYFTKWIEAELVAQITSHKVQHFVWRNIVCCFGIPKRLVSNNGTQFASQQLGKLCIELGVKQVFALVEHPQTNGQVESANKVLLNKLRERLGTAKGRWTEELPEVLWAYRCTPQSTTQETPYSLTYGTEAMIPVEVGEPSIRRQLFDLSLNKESLAVGLDLLNELRDKSKIREAACKLRASRRYNSKVQPRKFHQGDLVWRMRNNARKSDGKFSSNWEGLFRIREVGEGGGGLTTWNSYREKLYLGRGMPRT